MPDTFEKIGHGAPVMWAKKKPFVMMADNHHNDGRLAVWVRATHEAQDLFVQSDPKRFFIPPYVGVQGWIGIRLEGRPPWRTIEDLLGDAHRLAVTKPPVRVAVARRTRRPS